MSSFALGILSGAAVSVSTYDIEVLVVAGGGGGGNSLYTGVVVEAVVPVE